MTTLQLARTLQERHGLATLVQAALVPVAEVMTLCAFGFVLALPSINVMSEAARRLLGKLVFALFLPCLIFVHLGETLTLQQLRVWWFIPANVLISAIIGFFLGILIVRLTQPPPSLQRLVVAMTSVANIGNIPLAVLNSICRSRDFHTFGPRAACQQHSVAYVAFAQWVGALLVYTFVYHLVEPPSRSELEADALQAALASQHHACSGRSLSQVQGVASAVDPALQPALEHRASSRLWTMLVETEFPALHEVAERNPGMREPLLSRLLRSVSSVPSPAAPGSPAALLSQDPAACSEEDGEQPPASLALRSGSEAEAAVPWQQQQQQPTSPQDKGSPSAPSRSPQLLPSDSSLDGDLACLPEPPVVRRLRLATESTPLPHLLQPPAVASLLAILVGATPRLKALVFGGDAPLGFMADSLAILAGGMIPCIMLVLGGNLSAGPSAASRLSLQTVAAVTAARLLLSPLLGLAVVAAADRLQLLPRGDPLMRLVLLLQHAMPSSILAGAMASLRGYGQREVASLLFWQHVLLAGSLAVLLPAFLQWVLV